ncbi:MAG: CRISPR-associated protein Cas4 [Chthonomonadales bacterium]|nr:CRISPR-associated protein Cas4 [Chthonomonadales bacterium]
MTWTDDDLIMVSALEHYAYCPRQFALIHIESVWDENVFTLKGTRLHERMDEPVVETRAGLRVERALPIWSDHLGLVGRCDIVEFQCDGTPYPVEAKPSKTARRICHDVQVCAQGMCLEEMFGVPVPAGAISYLGSNRRREVDLTNALRHTVETMVDEIRRLLRTGVTPPPVNDSRCPNCSLIDACVPEVIEQVRASRLERSLYIPEPEP